MFGRGVHHQVVAGRNLEQAAQRAAQQAGQMAAIFSRQRRFELMIVRARQNPDFVRHARSVRAKGVVIADAIHHALGLAHFLAQDVAKNAALAFAKPFARRTQLVQNAPRHKSGGRDLRMRVRPFFAGLRAVVLEHRRRT